MDCLTCSSANPEGKRFCGDCGAPLPRRCTICGAENPAEKKFCGECGAKLATQAPAISAEAASRSQPAPPVSAAERRQLTVMFCDLVGSTAMAFRLDPEDVREVIGTYHRCVAATVSRYGGFAAKYMGDGVLVYFGYPQAHEDDAERAVRSGLALVENVRRLEAVEQLHVRVGIATGLVVVGELSTGGEATECGVVGDTPNLAARLQALAEADCVVIAPSTRRLIGGFFDCEELGPVAVKGYSEPVRLTRVLAESAVGSRYEALHSGGADTPLVGREEEIDLLLRRWGQARAADGRVVLIAGEPGIGKSRLIVAVQEKLQAEAHARLRYFCSPYHTDSALQPIVGQLGRAAGFERGDATETRLAKLEALLASTMPPDEDVALLADLLSIPPLGRYPALSLPPQRRKEKTLEALQRQIELLALRHPVLMVFEDVHWIDPTSRELLDLTVERTKRLPLLLLITFRPEFRPPWEGQAHVTTLALNRLDPGDGVTLVKRIVGDGYLPDDIVAEIVDRTDGVPLFVEELTQAVLEASSPGEASQTISAAAPPVPAVPVTLHASLMARLDRLGPAAKEAAQIGAGIGREFAHEFFVAVAGRAGRHLDAALNQLVEANLLFRRGTPPQSVYLFKHALVQDAAYGTLLRGARQDLHRRIVAALEKDFPEQVEALPELLARHATSAGLTEKAIAHWGKAGQKSLARFALAEAMAQLRKGLEQLATLPPTPALRRQEIGLQVTLGAALLSARGYAAPETTRAFEQAAALIERARSLGDALDDDPMLPFVVMYGVWVSCYIAGRPELLERAENCMAQAEILSASGPLLVAHRILGTTHLVRGEFLAARPHLDEAVALYDPDRHRLLAPRFGQDLRDSALVYRAWLMAHLGYPADATRDIDEAIAWARHLAHVPTLAYTLWHVSVALLLCRDVARCSECADEVVALAEEHRLPLWRGAGRVSQGWALAERGQLDEGLDVLARGIALYEETGAFGLTSLFKGLLALAQARAGAVQGAFETLDAGFAVVSAAHERWTEAELHRIRGVVLLQTPSAAAEAEECMHRALAIARRQGAKLYELRAATSLARLWCERGHRARARDLLAPAYRWFTQGFEAPDLREAKALLDNLGP